MIRHQFADACGLIAEAETIAGETTRKTAKRRKLVKARIAEALNTLPSDRNVRKQARKAKTSADCVREITTRISGVRTRARTLRAGVAACTAAAVRRE